MHEFIASSGLNDLSFQFLYHSQCQSFSSRIFFPSRQMSITDLLPLLKMNWTEAVLQDIEGKKKDWAPTLCIREEDVNHRSAAIAQDELDRSCSSRHWRQKKRLSTNIVHKRGGSQSQICCHCSRCTGHKLFFKTLKAKKRLSTNIVHKRGGCRNSKITKPKQWKSSGLIEQRLKLTSMPCEDKIDGRVCSKNVSRRKSGFTSQKVDLDHLQNHSIRTETGTPQPLQWNKISTADWLLDLGQTPTSLILLVFVYSKVLHIS